MSWYISRPPFACNYLLMLPVGLDPAKFSTGFDTTESNADVSFAPTVLLDERLKYKDVEKLFVTCMHCHQVRVRYSCKITGCSHCLNALVTRVPRNLELRFSKRSWCIVGVLNMSTAIQFASLDKYYGAICLQAYTSVLQWMVCV